MKKFTSFMLMLLCAVTTWGQMLEVGKVYQLKSGRSTTTTTTVMNMTSSETRTATIAENDYSQYWAVEKGTTEGTYALYNLNFKKYIKPYQGTNTTWSVSETKTTETDLYISVENETSGVISIRYSETSAAGTHNGAHHEGWFGGIVSWEATAEASQWTPIYIGTIDELNAQIANNATLLETKKASAEEILTASEFSMTQTKIALQVDDANAAGYLWANTYAAGDEGVIDYLIDGNNNTFFHTSWSGYATDGTKDYVEIDLGTDNSVESISFDYVTRHNGNTDFPTSITLLGSNDKTTYEEIGSVNSGLPIGNTKSYTSPIFNNGNSYRYIRFQVNSTSRGDASIPYFHLAELNFYKIEATINEEYKEYLSEISALKAAYDEYATTTPNDVSSSLASLTSAIDAYNDANREVTLTYHLYFGDRLIETQSIAGLVGDAFPQPNIKSSWTYVVANNIPEGNVEGAGEHDITLTVSGRPFNAADSYNTIENWYYLNITASAKYLYYTEGAEYIELTQTAVDASNKDAYTWAFVGNPFDGYQIVNKAAGETMILSSSTTISGDGASTYPIMTATPVTEGNTYWVATSSTYRDGGFYLAQKDYASNRMNNRGDKLAYWTGGADGGSTFAVIERDMSGATELQAAIDAIKGKYTEGTAVGYIESLAALNDAIANAETAVENKTGCDEAQIALQAAINALVTVQPTEGKFYHIVSSCTTTSGNDPRAGQKMYVNNTGGMQFQNATTMGEVFQFVSAGDNKFYLYNVERGTYLNTAKTHGNGQETALATTTEDAVKVAISNLGSENIVEIVPEGGAMIHAQANGSAIVGWNANEDVTVSASAWTIEEVTDITTHSHDVTVSKAGYATLYLNYAVTIPDGVNVYGVTEATNGWAIMEKISGTIPAKTGVILENAGDFTFNYSNNAGEGTSILKGTLLDENRTEDAYVLGNPNETVGLYLATKNQAENTAFKNNAFKAFLVPEVKEEITSYSFNFDWNGTTGIENIEDAVEENAAKAIYDITGRQIKAITVPGIYIINGKKTFVK